MPSRPPLPSLLALTLGVLAAAGPVRAERGETQIGLQPAYAITYAEQRSPSGGGGDARIQYSLTDAVGIQAVGGLTAHPLTATAGSEDGDPKLPGGLLMAWYANLGVVYALDVVRIMPFFEASVGVLGLIARLDPVPGVKAAPALPPSSVHVGVMLGIGADYLVNRRFSVGVGLRYHANLTDLSRLPLHLTVGPRVSLRFGR